MANFKFEYVWTDGWEPTPHLRSKTKIIEQRQLSNLIETKNKCMQRP